MINENPLVSIVVPSYNREMTIERALLSLVNQTYQNIEIVVADDCSNDNTVAVAKGINDSRIKIIQLKENAGAQAARNTAIKNARGKWVAFLDSDDEWVPQKLMKQIRVLQEKDFNEEVVIYTDCYEYYPVSGKKIHHRLKSFQGKSAHEGLLQESGTMFPGILVSMKLLKKIDYLDEGVPSYQEWDTAIRLAEYGDFIHLKEPLFWYYLGHGETISKDEWRDIKGYEYVFRKHYETIKSICGKKIVQRHLLLQCHKCLNYGFYDQAEKYLDELKGRFLPEERIALLLRKKIDTVRKINLPCRIVRIVTKMIRSKISK